MKNETNLFESFAKGKKHNMARGSNCVIYTRVSTKEQADHNFSLETQKKACELYAKKIGYQIMGYFGGTYESAKNDERKEFTNMLSFVKKSRDKISHIIVYSVDRFSRSGANAIYLAEQLKKTGVSVYSVSQPTDTTTASGALQQNIQFIFSEYDNQLRREKCMAGTKETLQRGVWCTAPPVGYDIVKTNGKKELVINAKGKLLRKAFYWKANDKVTNEEIIKRLAALGLKMTNQRMSAFFRNPFYCGLLVHTALEGQTVEGNHEKLISKDLFLEVNGILSVNKQGYRINPENDDIPLKRFFKCEECGKFLRGYKATKNQEYYYKCNTLGCKCNKRAESLHSVFEDLLSRYCLELDDDMRYLIKQQMVATYNQLSKQKKEDATQIEKHLKEMDKKLERLEVRYMDEEFTKDMFEKYKLKYITEKQEIEKQMGKIGIRVSNLDLYIDTAFNFSSKLATVWHSSDYNDKQLVQFLVFPEGIYYNRKKEECRTPKTNKTFSYFSEVARVSESIEKGNYNNILQFPSLVARTGIEPMTFGL